MEEKDRTAQGLVIGAVGGIVLGVTGTLLLARPAEAAPPEEKWEYLLTCQEAIIALLQQILAAQGGIPPGEPGVEITVKTPWVAKEPEQIFSRDIRVVGTFDSDMMVNWLEGKRILIKVESSLNQIANIQVVGNFVDDMNLATNIDPPWPCPANGNISIGLAWDDWHPFIGVRVITAIAPGAGIINIWVVIQE